MGKGTEVAWGEPKPKSFDEKMREGKSLNDGLSGAMSMRDESYEPWDYQEPRRARKHKPTRCGHDEND